MLMAFQTEVLLTTSFLSSSLDRIQNAAPLCTLCDSRYNYRLNYCHEKSLQKIMLGLHNTRVLYFVLNAKCLNESSSLSKLNILKLYL